MEKVYLVTVLFHKVFPYADILVTFFLTMPAMDTQYAFFRWNNRIIRLVSKQFPDRLFRARISLCDVRVRLPEHHAVIGRVVVQSRHRLYPVRLFQVLSAPLLVRHAVSEHVEERVGLGGDLPVAFLHSVISGSECL